MYKIDLAMHDSAVTRKFVRINNHLLGTDNSRGCNSNSVSIIGAINEYTEQYAYFSKVGIVVSRFLKNSDEQEVYNRFFTILHSVKEQNKFFKAVKMIAKKTPVKNEDAKSILRSVERANNRFKYLYENIFPEYLNLTPVSSYIKELKAAEKDFKDDITEHIHILPGQYLDDEEVNAYCDYILLNCKDESWKKNLDEYKAVRAKQEERKATEKKEKEREKEETKFLNSQNFLNAFSRTFYHNFMTAGARTHARGYVNVGCQCQEFNKRGEICKVIIFLKSGRQTENAIRYYADGNKELLGSLSSATVVNEKMELPKELMDKVESKQFAFCEVVLN